MARGDPPKKCPRCKKRFPATRDGHAKFMRHWYKAHHKSKAKAKPKKVWKAPKRR